MASILVTRHPEVDVRDIADEKIDQGEEQPLRYRPLDPLPSIGEDDLSVALPPPQRPYVVPTAREQPEATARFPLRLPPPPVLPATTADRTRRLAEIETRAQELDTSLTKYQALSRRRIAQLDDESRAAPSPSVRDRLEAVRAKTQRDLDTRNTIRSTSNTLLDGLRARLGVSAPPTLPRASPYDSPTYDRAEQPMRPPEWMTDEEADCFRLMEKQEQEKLLAAYEKMREAEPDHTQPLRLRVLNSSIPDTKKMEIFNRLRLQLPGLGEGPKYTAWVSSLLTVPFGVTTPPPCSPEDPKEVQRFLMSAREVFDKEVYGQHRVKDEFVSILGAWLQAEESCTHGNVVGIAGPVGVGKTTMAQALAKVMGRPFYFISLGGSCYGATLQGHSYTYEGATFGEVARALIETGCEDPVLFFDELDKVADNDRGEEVQHLLVHITDPQNPEFVDRYFAGTPLNISKALIVFSYNHKEKVNPILRNRIHEICLKDFEPEEKVVIASDYVMPRLKKDMNVKPDMVQFAQGALEHLVTLCAKAPGVRLIKALLIRLTRMVIVASMTEGEIVLGVEKELLPTNYEITRDVVDAVYKNYHDNVEEEDVPPEYMYM